MKVSIENLESTTFQGKRFTRKQIAIIQETVEMFPELSRRELGHTICEAVNWTTPKGTNCIQACLSTLEEMEKYGLFNLPTLKKKTKRTAAKIIWTERTNEQPTVNDSLEQAMPIHIQKVTEKPDIGLWNEYVDRYHYLGYKRPMGSHLRYFIVSQKEGRILGCLSFSFASLNLDCRDTWIGWEKKDREKRLHLVINNNRFLIFPWVNIKHLASKTFSLVGQQIEDDWEEVNGYRPLLLETFVDPDKYKGTCYRASNWQHIGKTRGRQPSKSSNTPGISKKNVFVYPLRSDFRAILTYKKKQPKPRKKNIEASEFATTFSFDDPFIGVWQHMMLVVQDIAKQFDKKWQKRKRTLNTMLIILFIFRLVFAKNKQGYGITIRELWDQCRHMKVKLPQSKPVAASAFCNARQKLDETIFKMINNKIVISNQSVLNDDKWKGHRIYAVDGTKINLPRPLRLLGYPIPSGNAHYPQGLVSCLYQLKPKLPYDFDLVSHADERQAALAHLKTIHRDDVVVYDRGYFSYMMLFHHLKLGIHPVFRIQKQTYSVIQEFIAGTQTDHVVTIIPSAKTKRDILTKNPGIEIVPLKLRLLKYTRSGTTYILGTTLFDQEQYKEEVFPDVYHSRWGIEELYKISKVLINVEDFHGQNERGVKQELFAHFVLISLSRLFSNKVEKDFKSDQCILYPDHETEQEDFKVNFKNSLVTIARSLEAMFLKQVDLVQNTLKDILNSLSNCKQKIRPNRSYERKSMKPVGKWRPEKKVKNVTSTATV